MGRRAACSAQGDWAEVAALLGSPSEPSETNLTAAKSSAGIRDDSGGAHTYSGLLDFEPTWSPDGKTIVFASNRDDPYNNAGMCNDQSYDELYEVDPNGSNLRPLSFTKPSKWVKQATFHSANGAAAGDTPRTSHAGRQHRRHKKSPLQWHRPDLALQRAHRQPARRRLGRTRRSFRASRRGHTLGRFPCRPLNLRSQHPDTQNHPPRQDTTHPLDLSVAGRRIAWAENTNGHGRIRSLELPS